MLSCYSRRLFSSLAWRNSQILPISSLRNDFCSTVKPSDEVKDASEEKTSETVSKTIDVNEVLNAGDKQYVQKACRALMQICEMKRLSEISEDDYKNDERFLSMLKTLESQHVEKADTMLIISSLKVEVTKLVVKRDEHCIAGIERVGGTQ